MRPHRKNKGAKPDRLLQSRKRDSERDNDKRKKQRQQLPDTKDLK